MSCSSNCLEGAGFERSQSAQRIKKKLRIARYGAFFALGRQVARLYGALLRRLKRIGTASMLEGALPLKKQPARSEGVSKSQRRAHGFFQHKNKRPEQVGAFVGTFTWVH
jgi:hypothetical protein